MVIGIFAILKAGGAYVPLDPDYPKARLAYMLSDANLTTVITQQHLLESSPVTAAQAVCIDDPSIVEILQKQPSTDIASDAIDLNPDHLAYVIYTSGSTGNPKGVMIRHAGLVNLVEALADRYQLVNTDVVLQFAPISFDMSVEEIFGALSTGATLIVRNNDWLESVDTFYQYCQATGVTVLNLPTAFWHELARDPRLFGAPSVRHISVGGEKISELEIENWFAKSGDLPRLLNAYGPTEATVNASFADVMQGYKNNIGKPLANMSLHVLNSHLQLSPIGVAGELYIGGVGLAKGYLNRPDLTAEKFITNPYYDESDPNSSKLIYKTGDLARRLPNGDLEYAGRVDHQIKIRGFRIELGEIENALNTHEHLKEAIVLAEASPAGDMRLIAYVVTDAVDVHDETEVTLSVQRELIETLRNHVKQVLPHYMVPGAFVLLEQLPLTPNGKLDRKALSELDLSVQQATFVAPRTEIERMLCEICQEILGVERVGMTDNFFQLGGHSLLLMKLLASLENKFNLRVSAKLVFEYKDIQGIAEYLTLMCMALPKLKSADTAEEMETFQI
jgi:amino acid adenylation domain-containing protein